MSFDARAYHLSRRKSATPDGWKTWPDAFERDANVVILGPIGSSPDLPTPGPIPTPIPLMMDAAPVSPWSFTKRLSSEQGPFLMFGLFSPLVLLSFGVFSYAEQVMDTEDSLTVSKTTAYNRLKNGYFPDALSTAKGR